MNCQMRTPVAGRKVCVALPAVRTTSEPVVSTKTVTTALTASFAALVAAAPSHAVQQIATIAEEDNRLNVLLLLFVPVVGWVGLNILGPLQTQMKEMKARQEKMGLKGLAVALPMAAAAAAAPTHAAMEVAGVAETPGIKYAGVSLFIIAMGIWIAMYLYADNSAGLLEEDKIGK